MIREINIQPVLNGFICHVGCQKVVFNNLPAMLLGIEQYYKNPELTEKEYLNTAINKNITDAPAPCQPECESPRDVMRNVAQAVPLRR